METIKVYVQILEKEITSLSGSGDLIKKHENFYYIKIISEQVVGYFQFNWTA